MRLNIVYRESEKRGFLKLNALSLSFTVISIGFVVAALAAVVVVPVVLNCLGLSHFADLVVRISRWPVMFVVLTLALACVYRFGPSRAAPRWRWITWGSAAATIMWLAASGLFSWYATNFGKFNETYGSSRDRGSGHIPPRLSEAFRCESDSLSCAVPGASFWDNLAGELRCQSAIRSIRPLQNSTRD
ncbi:YihY/virulence factor BrkB family protein [Bradyrhizobium sp. McL0616]|uniref:YihY/virulence factor BrkB family protein n=1 Tax=Bradyrhizobium sp. McL0616 TaxID=3415674 RepID=UPI003CEB505E